MLSVPVLDDLSFEKLFERARSQIPMYSGSWTDFNHTDPGVTALQTFSWLTDMLNYYIDATGERHRLAYLRLLGIAPEQAAATCTLALSAANPAICLAPGAKLLAGDVVFELCEGYSGVSNEVTALLNKIGSSYIDLMPFAGADGGYAPVFGAEKSGGATLFIGFERELSGELRLYADIPMHGRRNPFDDDFRLARLKWEYYNGARWLPATGLYDETGGFLKSGFIGLALGGASKPLQKHKSLPPAHYLRVRPEGEFDARPLLGKIYMNCARAVQTDTCAHSLVMVSDGGSRLVIDRHIGEDDTVCVAVEEGDGFALWFEHAPDGDSLCDVVRGDYPWQRAIVFDSERFGVSPCEGRRILVMITRGDMLGKLRLGVTGGYSRERMTVDLPNLFELRLGLVSERDGRAFFRLWEQCENIGEAACDARVFEYRRESGEIEFGDSIAGLQPDAGQTVVAVTAKTSLLEKGNVRSGSVGRFADPSLGGIRVWNPSPAAGGSRPKTARELEPEIEELLRRTTRAVTEQDYKNIVMSAPGLMMDRAAVISGAEYARANGQNPEPGAVFVVAKPYSGYEERPALTEAYRRRIREHLERFRLLTTDVRVVPARYTGIEVSGCIALTENTPRNRERVEQMLSGLIDCGNDRGFGANVVYGRVFSQLEMMDCVARVAQLSFSCAGGGAEKTGQGDILVSPDAMTFLAGVSIEFV